MRWKYLIKNDEIIIVNKHLAKIENQILYHALYCLMLFN